MTPILGLLILAAIAGLIGFQTIVANLRHALTTAGWGAARGGVAVLEGAQIAWPYAARALVIWIVVLGLSAALVAAGITIHQSWPTLIGAVIGWIALFMLFAALGIIAHAAALAVGAVERVGGWFLTAVTAMLSWLGLAQTVREGRFELVNERLLVARLGEMRRKTYALWWLVTAVLAAFPFWGFAMVLLPTLMVLAIAGSYLADWRGYQIEFFWRVLYGGIALAFVVVIFTFLFPMTAMAIRTRIFPDADRSLWCSIDTTSDECRNEGLRRIGERVLDDARGMERTLRRVKGHLAPPAASPPTPVLPPGGDESDAPPEGLPPTAPTARAGQT